MEEYSIMHKNEKFQAKQRGASKVQIGPRISITVKQDIERYCINTCQNFQDVVEVALVQFLADKDLAPVVQLQLAEALEVTYGDPRFQGLKGLIERARVTSANRLGREKLIAQMSKEYHRLVREVGMCVALKMEYEEALGILVPLEAET